MPFFPFVLVVLAAFIHASWNLLAKRAAPAGAIFVFAYSLVACVAYLPWVGWILARNDLAPGLAVAGCICLSAVIHLAYGLCLQRGYQVADLSVVYPVARGTGPMLSSVGAFIVLGEAPSRPGLLGLAAVIAGIGMISTQGDMSLFRRPHAQQGVRWGMVTGALIASYTLVDGYGVKFLGIHPVILDWFSNLLRCLMLAPLVLSNHVRASKAMRGRWLLVVGVGLLSPLSYILVLSAIDMGAPLSLVAPAREMSMMVGAMFGMLILREPVNAWRIFGCLSLVAGVVLLAAA